MRQTPSAQTEALLSFRFSYLKYLLSLMRATF